MALTVCAEAGCHELTDRTRCAAHHRERRRSQDHQRPNANARGYDSVWAAERKRFLHAHPWCRCGAKATDVHHLDGLGPRGPRGRDWANLEQHCHSCHSSVTATMQPGGFAA